MRLVECEQYTPSWWEARRGIPTASQFGRILTPKTCRLSASAGDYICELLAQEAHLGPLSDDGPVSKEMANGRECEPEARRWYEMERDCDVQQVGFVLTDDGRFGCSPDGLVGEDGGLELKCPTLKTQVGYLLAGELPSEYRAQVHGSLIVTGRSWWDFLSYAPGLPPLLIRVEPDEYTESLRAALEEFHAQHQEARRLLVERGWEKPAG